jgi:hypothetical protein
MQLRRLPDPEEEEDITNQHGITSHNTQIFSNTAARTSNLTKHQSL